MIIPPPPLSLSPHRNPFPLSLAPFPLSLSIPRSYGKTQLSASSSEWLEANYSDNYSELYGCRSERLRAAAVTKCTAGCPRVSAVPLCYCLFQFFFRFFYLLLLLLLSTTTSSRKYAREYQSKCGTKVLPELESPCRARNSFAL